MSSGTTRTREKGSITSSSNHYSMRKDTTCAENSWVLNGYGLPRYNGEKHVMTDVVTPGFRKIRSQGGVVFNPLRQQIAIATDSGGIGPMFKSVANTCNNPVKKGLYSWETTFLPHMVPMHSSGYVVPIALFSESDITSAWQEASTKVLSQRGRGDANLYETLAELDQTVKLLDINAEKVSRTARRFQRALRAGMFPGYAANGVAKAWLMYRYAIMPTVKDTIHVIDTLKKRVQQRKRMRVTTRANVSMQKFDSTDIYAPFDSLGATLRRVVTQKVTVRAMSLDEAVISLLDELGFSLKSLITLPWELVTLSFVADWFASIGDFIGALVPAFGWENLGSSAMIINDKTTSYQFVSGTSILAGYTIERQPSGSISCVFRDRQRLGLSSPTINVKSDFRFDRFTRSADAWAVASALTAQIGKMFPTTKRS